MSEAKIADLGWCMAKATKDSLTIVMPADSSEHAYAPAQSIHIFRTRDLIALRDLLNSVLRPEDQP